MSGGAYGRRAYMGDPGLFGFLGKVASSALGAIPVVGGAAKGIFDQVTGIGRQAPSVATPTIARVKASNGFAPPVPRGYGGLISVNPPMLGAPGAGVSTYVGPMGGGNGTQVQAMNGKAPGGYHWNKTSYFLKDGTYVPEGSKLVKNRRRNPLNPRAASRAISRLESAKKATRRLNRISIKCKRCGYSSCRCK
jgi:hypothetical protein